MNSFSDFRRRRFLSLLLKPLKQNDQTASVQAAEYPEYVPFVADPDLIKTGNIRYFPKILRRYNLQTFNQFYHIIYLFPDSLSLRYIKLLIVRLEDFNFPDSIHSVPPAKLIN